MNRCEPSQIASGDIKYIVFKLGDTCDSCGLWYRCHKNRWLSTKPVHKKDNGDESEVMDGGQMMGISSVKLALRTILRTTMKQLQTLKLSD